MDYKEVEKILSDIPTENPFAMTEMDFIRKIKHLNDLLDQALKDYEELQIRTEKALKITQELYEEGEEWHWDSYNLKSYAEELETTLKGGKND